MKKTILLISIITILLLTALGVYASTSSHFEGLREEREHMMGNMMMHNNNENNHNSQHMHNEMSEIHEQVKSVLKSGSFDEFKNLKTKEDLMPMLEMIETEEEFKTLQDWHQLKEKKFSEDNNQHLNNHNGCFKMMH